MRDWNAWRAILESLLLAIALALPYYGPGKNPETPEARRDRVEVIVSAAVAVAATPPASWPGSQADLAAAILAKTWFESRHWSLEVHSGALRGDQGRSCGLGQLWGLCAHVGTSPAATRRHLAQVAAVLSWAAQRCQVRHATPTQMARAFTLYGTGRTCRPASWSWPRVRLYERLRTVGYIRDGPRRATI